MKGCCGKKNEGRKKGPRWSSSDELLFFVDTFLQRNVSLSSDGWDFFALYIHLQQIKYVLELVNCINIDLINVHSVNISILK